MDKERMNKVLKDLKKTSDDLLGPDVSHVFDDMSSNLSKMAKDIQEEINQSNDDKKKTKKKKKQKTKKEDKKKKKTKEEKELEAMTETVSFFGIILCWPLLFGFPLLALCAYDEFKNVFWEGFGIILGIIGFILCMIYLNFEDQLNEAMAHYLINKKNEWKRNYHQKSQEKKRQKDLEKKKEEVAKAEENAARGINLETVEDFNSIAEIKLFYASLGFIQLNDLKGQIDKNYKILSEAEKLEPNIKRNLSEAFDSTSLSYAKFADPINNGFRSIVNNSKSILRESDAYLAYQSDAIMTEITDHIKENSEILEKLGIVNANIIAIAIKESKKDTSKDLDDLINESELYK